MRKIKKIVSLAVTIALVGSLAGCGSSNSSGSSGTSEGGDTSTSSGDKPYVAVVSKGFQHQFWQVVKKGADQAAADLGVTITFEGPASESDINDQVNMINSALSKKPSALALAALDTQAVSSQLAEAQKQGIPVVGFDSGVPGAPEGQVAANAATDNYNAATIPADKLLEVETIVEKIKGATAASPVAIGVVSQDATSASLIDRTKGFIDRAFEKCEELVGAGNVEVVGHDSYNKKATGEAIVKIVVNVPPTTSATDVQNSAQAVLATENLIAIYGSNQGGVDGILAASNDGSDFNKENGKYKDIVAVGFDSGKGQKTAVEKGWFLGSVTQDPYQIGYQAVALAVKAMNGEEVSDVDTGAKWYNQSNFNDEDINQLLYD
ncbi:ABC transporter substrate-binding protein [Clostridium sp. NSJ-49]|uniref:ABC transporter substrate-binding protein n=1 Tax=Clostridium TaxID=1485 RepID=UPI00164B7CCD|nr:ABC transporter substrate-binding protein [Clostridium sp. NSJ-49]MBC5624062.1 ABC transporter substrate-binding protein [Clostridium sp. NSJ-49]